MRIAGTLQHVDARAKLVGLVLILVACVSTPPEQFEAFAGYALLAALGCWTAGVRFRSFFAPALIVLPVIASAAVFIPWLHPGEVGGAYTMGISESPIARSGWMVLWNISIKAVLGVVYTRVFMESTSFSNVANALNQCRCPRILVLLLTFAYRYAALLAEEAARMKRAADARGYGGRWVWQAGMVGRLIGSLFLRSYERGERVYLAMLARGYQGGAAPPQVPLRGLDYGFMSALFLALGILRWGAI